MRRAALISPTYPEGVHANCTPAASRTWCEAHVCDDRNFIRADWPAVYYEEIIAHV
jgi:hypothetical protein